MRIAVVGTGYVGLVTGTCLAETGNRVTCVDIDEEKILRLKGGEAPIYEPGLDGLLRRNLRQERLSFTTDLALAVRRGDVVFLALPTPPASDGSADLTCVLEVAERLKDLCEEYRIIVTKSTVPVGTAEKISRILAADPRAKFDVVSNPEFLREGVAIEDFMKPDRVVIGASSSRAREVLGRLYAPFVRQGNPILYMDVRSAEMTKYAANSLLATKITFMNEIANICERVGADVDQVRKGVGTDSRIGKSFLFPGIGFGGSCFPKDVEALTRMGEESGYPCRVLRSVLEVNNDQRLSLARKVIQHYGDDLSGLAFGVWGLAFKPSTDDVREAPALYVIHELLALGARVSVYDPEAMENSRRTLKDRVHYCRNQYEAIEDADGLIICTEWTVFRSPDFRAMANMMRAKVVLDGRNLFELEEMEELGFYYNSIGRRTVGEFPGPR